MFEYFWQTFVLINDHFSGPRSAVGLVYVCVCVCMFVFRFSSKIKTRCQSSRSQEDFSKLVGVIPNVLQTKVEAQCDKFVTKLN